MQNKKTTLLALAAALGLAGAANAQVFLGDTGPAASGESGVFAFWNFESIPTDGSPIAATYYGQSGSTAINFSGYGGNLASFGGTTINEQTGFEDAENDDLALQNGSGDSIVGTFFQIDFDMTNLENLVIDYAIQGSGTGADDVTWQWSTDGSTFTDFGPNVGAGGEDSVSTRVLASSVFGAISTDALDGVETASLRMFFNGVPSDSTTAGNNRIDNLTLSGTAVPEPSSFALIAGMMGLACVMLRRRRD